eukprot:4125907-Prymnesium_polylepis.1
MSSRSDSRCKASQKLNDPLSGLMLMWPRCAQRSDTLVVSPGCTTMSLPVLPGIAWVQPSEHIFFLCPVTLAMNCAARRIRAAGTHATPRSGRATDRRSASPRRVVPWSHCAWR